MADVTATGGPPQLTRRRRRQRYRAQVLSAAVPVLLMLVVIATCVALAALVGPARWSWLFGYDATEVAVPVGLSVGVAASALVIYRVRVWLHRLRLRWLRRSGESAVAEAVSIAGDPTNLTVLEGYVVFVRWRDLAGEYVGDRCYRFWDGAPHDFLARFQRGQAVVVRYPPTRPHRFVIDIPYAPSIADTFI